MEVLLLILLGASVLLLIRAIPELLNRKKFENSVNACQQVLDEHSYHSDFSSILFDLESAVSVSASDQSIVLTRRDGYYERIAATDILDVSLTETVRTSISARSNFAGFDVGGVFLGGGGTSGSICEDVEDCWVHILVRDVRNPVRHLRFAGPDGARDWVGRIRILKEEAALAR